MNTQSQSKLPSSSETYNGTEIQDGLTDNKRIHFQALILGYLSELKFQEECKVTIDIVSKVDNYLKNTGWLYACSIVGINTLNIKQDYKDPRCHIILVVPKGHSKSTFMRHIFKPSKSLFLPNKAFESLLVKNKKNIFDNKVIINDDLIPLFTGLNTKQLQQFTGLF